MLILLLKIASQDHGLNCVNRADFGLAISPVIATISAMPKLPKTIAAHPKLAQVEELLSRSPTLLWPGSKLSLPKWGFTDVLRHAVHSLGLSGHLSQGLESAGSELSRERHGLEVLQKKTGQVQTQRMSRFLLLSNDGSERFYHDAESLLASNREILWGAILDATSEELGSLLTPPKSMVKALLINDRKALERFLLALV
jgi:hypothetical protein